MLVASFRQLQSHAQKMRVILSAAVANRQLIALCTSDKFQQAVNIRVGDKYDEITAGQSRFSTGLPGLLGTYFEVWTYRASDQFLLNKAYLHFHAAVTASDPTQEVLFLHTEPVSAAQGANASQIRAARWRSGPHVHLKASQFGLGRCHFHLDACNSPCPALASLSAYQSRIRMMIEMLTDELAEYFDPSQTI